MKNIKSKLKILGITIAATIGAMLLFITVIGAGNYVQSLNYKFLGNIVMTLFPLVILLYVVWLNRKVNKLTPKSYGFKINKLAKNIFLGLGLPVLLISVSIMAASSLTGIKVSFLPVGKDIGEAILINFWTLFIVGVWEEFFFRGFVFTSLVKGRFGFHLSALLSSVLFSIMHWSSFDSNGTSSSWYFGIVLLSYFITVLYAVTGSIWSIVSFHLCWNFCAQLLDGEHNGIGLIAITDYGEHAKAVDDFMVVCLGVILVITLLLQRTKLKQLYSSKENFNFPLTQHT